MSTQVQETQTANAGMLDAAAVKAVLDSPSSRTATANYPITVTIYENLGKAFISWVLDPNYAIGQLDTVQIRGNGVFVANFPVTVHNGSVNTTQVWGTGWNASYWSMDYPSGLWRQLVSTPNT